MHGLFAINITALMHLTLSSAADESGAIFCVFCKNRDTFGSRLDEFVRHFHLPIELLPPELEPQMLLYKVLFGFWMVSFLFLSLKCECVDLQ